MKTLRDWLAAAADAAAAGRADAAMAAYREAIALAPGRADLHYNLGVLAFDVGTDADAERAFAAAERLRPGWPAAALALGRIAHRRFRYADAQRHFERALARAPDAPEALGNLALALTAQKRHDLALPHLQRARALAPADEDVWFALRGCLLALARDDDAWQDFLAFEAVAAPTARLVGTGFVAAIEQGDETRIARYLALAQEWPYVAGDAVLVAGVMARLQYLDVPRETLLAFYRTYNRLQQARRAGRPPLAAWRAGDGAPARRLRIGYLSADFRDHVMGRLLQQVFAAHDRGRFELFAYSLSPPEDADAMTARFRATFDAYVGLAATDDLAAAERIAADRVDVLVDLMAHSSLARPGILLYKPAPVIVTHLGYHGCVGLEQVDFKLTDAAADLPDAQRHQIEAPLAMGTCVLPLRRVAPEGPPPTRESAGIAADAVVFGTFVGRVKLSARCVRLWRDILDRVPGSVLAFSPYLDGDRAALLRRLARGGIAADRIAFLPSTWNEAKDRARYAVIDVVLDTMPYTGGDTTAAALDMGVPVVTRRGERHAERMSYSILSHLGLAATVAATDDEYVAIACRLALDPAWRADCAAEIRAAFAASPVADPAHYTRCLEAALAEAVRRGSGATN